MGNGCSSCKVEKENRIKPIIIKINKKTSNMNKQLIDINLINKFLSNVNLELSKEQKIGPYFINEFESINKIYYMNFLKKIKYFENNNCLIIDEYSKNTSYNIFDNSNLLKNCDLDLKYFFTIKNLVEIQWNFIVIEEKFQAMLNLFINYPLQEFRIIFYFMVLQSKNELFNSYQSRDSTMELLLINKLNSINDIIDEALERVINCDIPRTFPTKNIMKEDFFTKTLKETLLDITLIDKELGYVQGINFIVGYCLMLSGNNKEISITIFLSLMNMKSSLTGTVFKGKLQDLFLIKTKI